jgi:hypothetical protein
LAARESEKGARRVPVRAVAEGGKRTIAAVELGADKVA